MKKDTYPLSRKKKPGKADPSIESVYAGPEQPIMEDVYGGPEWMSKGMPDGELEEIEVPEEAEEEPEKKEAASGLPPFPPQQEQDPRAFMCVYAGPEYFNRGPQGKAMGAFILTTTDAQQGAANRKFCTNCGTPLPEKAKFCPECGVKLPESQKI